MELGNFAVIVDPGQWGGTLDDLATRLAPLMNSRPAALKPMLERGVLTIEAELSRPAAEQICQRLSRAGVQASIRGATSAAPASGSHHDADETWRRPALDDGGLLPSLDGFEEKALGEVLDFDDDALDALLGRKTPEAPEAPALEQPVSRSTVVGMAFKPPSRSTMQGMTFNLPAQREGRETFDMSFGATALPNTNIDHVPEAPPQDRAEMRATIKDDASPPAADLAPTTEDVLRTTARAGVVAGASEGDEAPGGWGELFPDIAPSTTHDVVARREPEPEPALPRVELLSEPAAAAVALPEPEIAPPAVAAPELREPELEIEPASRQFEGDRFAAAFGLEDGEQAPYKPQGYDNTTPHLPGLAMALSAIAPGAGQVYNGQDDEAFRYGVRFVLIKPWIESVRQARRHAERIDAFRAPRPPEGVVWRVLRYVLLWYGALVAIVVGLSLVGPAIYGRVTAKPVAVDRRADMERALLMANGRMLGARIAGIEAIDRAEEAAQDQGRSTMPNEERAERLFLIGYDYCKAKRYEQCRMFMKRVTQIKSNHRNAIRLQAWASGQENRATPRAPIPDIGVVESLSDYELRQDSGDAATAADMP